jgi:transcriptional regulator with XRE-family HTH domain
MQSHERKPITGAQLRAARALLRWSADDLAEKTKIGIATLRRAESADGPVGMTAANAASVRAALESAGVIFVEENGEGPGVRLRKNHMTTEPIYIDASKSAVLKHGVTSINCLTLQEAVIAYHNLPPERKEIAKITSGGKVYSASEIERFHYAERAK